MTPAEPHTLKAAMQIAIRSLGAARCAEICGGIAEASVYRYANINEPHLVPAHYALALDRECWLRDGLTPFRELFEVNAGAPIHERIAQHLHRMADQLKGAAA